MKANQVLEETTNSDPPELDANQWVDLYGDMMFRYTVVRVQDHDAAEDIVQTALIAALQARTSFEGRSAVKSWLFGILKHKILDHFRNQKTKNLYEVTANGDADPLERAFDESGHWIQPPTHWAFDPEKSAENSQLQETLASCLARLPEKYRMVFVLKEVEGMSTEDICETLNINSSNLWVILHRARNQLRKYMEQHFHATGN